MHEEGTVKDLWSGGKVPLTQSIDLGTTEKILEQIKEIKRANDALEVTLRLLFSDSDGTTEEYDTPEKLLQKVRSYSEEGISLIEQASLAPSYADTVLGLSGVIDKLVKLTSLIHPSDQRRKEKDKAIAKQLGEVEQIISEVKQGLYEQDGGN